jgi:hypothetical protein
LLSKLAPLVSGLHVVEESQERLDAVSTEGEVDGPAEVSVALRADTVQRQVLLEPPERLRDDVLGVELGDVANLAAVDARTLRHQ